VVYLKFIAVDAGNIRNLAMEKVAGSVLFPCRYVSNGCNATMPHTDKSSHEDGCEFRLACSHILCSFVHKWLNVFFVCEAAELLCEIKHQFIFIYGH